MESTVVQIFVSRPRLGWGKWKDRIAPDFPFALDFTVAWSGSVTDLVFNYNFGILLIMEFFALMWFEENATLKCFYLNGVFGISLNFMNKVSA